MKTLTVSEAAGNLAGWLKLAVAGEDIAIRSDDRIVMLRPVAADDAVEPLSPREALRILQQNASLTTEQADEYLNEVRAERLTAETRGA
jgi:antitoxin (DNA-binding transcriptional repressor) of toxin-antitoxin stability system